jgi:succinate dehydrogenase/fumarate reductase flavoprotein subunit
MDDLSFDIIVTGGGAAGLSAALTMCCTARTVTVPCCSASGAPR